MTTFEFQLGEVLRGYRSLAQRHAVLGPLFSAPRPRDSRFKKLQQVLRATWRARIRALREHGWDREGQYSRMANCPPFGVVFSPRMQPCGERRVCPFCRARLVGEMCDRILAASGDQFADRENWRIVEWSVCEHVKYPYQLPVFRRRNRIADSVLQRGRLGGALVCMQPDVVVDKTKDGLGYLPRGDLYGSGVSFLAEERGVMVVKRPTKLPRVVASIAGFQQRVLPLTRRNLAEAVGRTLRYPFGLIRGEPDKAVELAQTVYGHRLSATYGGWYGVKSKSNSFPEMNTTYETTVA